MKFLRSQKNATILSFNNWNPWHMKLFRKDIKTIGCCLKRVAQLAKNQKYIRHLYQLHVFMLLRYNRILRIFAILLFSFELLAPAFVLGVPESNLHSQSVKIHISEQNQPIDLIAHLIFEEVNNEEREGKDDYLISVCFIEVFNELQKFEPIQVTWSLPKDRFDTQPSLYTLHRVLLI
jgi:hypothetical protein